MNRILLIRATSGDGETTPEGADVLATHEIGPVHTGIQNAVEAATHCNILAITSPTAVKILKEAGADAVFSAAYDLVLVAGGATAELLIETGVSKVVVPGVPGARGIIDYLASHAGPLRILWPRGPDAATEPFYELMARGATLSDPVIYEKIPRKPLPHEILERLTSGGYWAVAIASLAALDAALSYLGVDGKMLPVKRWGAVGPATARELVNRGWPEPIVPARPRITDLIECLREDHP